MEAMGSPAPVLDNQRGATADGNAGSNAEVAAASKQPPISKNQLKRLRRQQQWEDRKDDRKRKRKEKRHSRQARRREERDAIVAEAEAAGLDPQEVLKAVRPLQYPRCRVPVSIIIDCDFEKFMRDTENLSLSSQLVRCYSQNRKGRYQTHLFFSSWKGFLKTRFEDVLKGHHKSWRDTHFIEDDFVEAAKQAEEIMRGPHQGTLVDTLKNHSCVEVVEGERARADGDSTPVIEPQPSTTNPSVVYLTSDSPYTLDKLEPHTSYVIGGIVDKNREKGLCYKIAMEKGVRTAKLPIGQYMIMQSRQVLTTNQVVEIMSKWLECGDWGPAFMSAIPKRKGGKLRGEDVNSASNPADNEDHEDDGEDDEEQDEQQAIVEAAESALLDGPDDSNP